MAIALASGQAMETISPIKISELVAQGTGDDYGPESPPGVFARLLAHQADQQKPGQKFSRLHDGGENIAEPPALEGDSREKAFQDPDGPENRLDSSIPLIWAGPPAVSVPETFLSFLTGDQETTEKSLPSIPEKSTADIPASAAYPVAVQRPALKDPSGALPIFQAADPPSDGNVETLNRSESDQAVLLTLGKQTPIGSSGNSTGPVSVSPADIAAAGQPPEFGPLSGNGSSLAAGRISIRVETKAPSPVRVGAEQGISPSPAEPFLSGKPGSMPAGPASEGVDLSPEGGGMPLARETPPAVVQAESISKDAGLRTGDPAPTGTGRPGAGSEAIGDPAPVTSGTNREGFSGASRPGESAGAFSGATPPEGSSPTAALKPEAPGRPFEPTPETPPAPGRPLVIQETESGLETGNGQVRRGPADAKAVDTSHPSSRVEVEPSPLRPAEISGIEAERSPAPVTGKTPLPDQGTDPFHLYRQVGKGLVWSLRRGEEKIQIALDPPELGNIVLELHRTKQTVEAQVWTDNPGTKGLLDAQQGQIQRAVEQSGFKLDRFEVAVHTDLKSFQEGRWTGEQQGPWRDPRESHEPMKPGQAHAAAIEVREEPPSRFQRGNLYIDTWI